MNSANELSCGTAIGRLVRASQPRTRIIAVRVLGAGLMVLAPTAVLAGQTESGYNPKLDQSLSAIIDPATGSLSAPDSSDVLPLEDGADMPATLTSLPADTAPRPGGVYGPAIPPDVDASPRFSWSEPPPATPPALAEAIAIASEKDPSVLAAWQSARAALQDVKGARWLRFPALSTGFVFYNRSSPITEQIAPQVNIQLPLWAGGRLGANIKRAKALEQSAISGWREAILNVVQQVVDSYYNIVLTTRLETYYRESLLAHQKLVGTIRRRVDQEVSPEVDFQLARSRAAQIEQELTSISAQRLSSLRTLAELVRDPNYRIGSVPSFDPAKATQNWDNVVAEAVAFSPTRERLQYVADAAQDAIKVSRGSIYPQLNAQYSYSDFVGSRFGVGLQLQTANGLSQFSAVSAATARAREATQQVALAVRQLKQNVEVQRVTQEAAVRRAQVSEVASDTAARVSESYVRQFIAGRRSWLDVLNSLREHLSQQVSLTQAEVGAQSAATRLNLVSGRWRLVHEEAKK